MPERPATDLDRRRLLGLGAAATAAVWVAPAILSTDAASAASQPPPPPPGQGQVSGTVTVCGHEVDPGDTFLVTATQNPGVTVASVTTNAFGDYSIGGLPDGTYDITLHPNGANLGMPDQTFKGAVTIVGGAAVTFSPDYTANGC